MAWVPPSLREKNQTEVVDVPVKSTGKWVPPSLRKDAIATTPTAKALPTETADPSFIDTAINAVKDVIRPVKKAYKTYLDVVSPAEKLGVDVGESMVQAAIDRSSFERFEKTLPESGGVTPFSTKKEFREANPLQKLSKMAQDPAMWLIAPPGMNAPVLLARAAKQVVSADVALTSAIAKAKAGQTLSEVEAKAFKTWQAGQAKVAKVAPKALPPRNEAAAYKEALANKVNRPVATLPALTPEVKKNVSGELPKLPAQKSVSPELPNAEIMNRLSVDDRTFIYKAEKDIKKALKLQKTAPLTADPLSGIKTKEDYQEYIKSVQTWINDFTKKRLKYSRPSGSLGIVPEGTTGIIPYGEPILSHKTVRRLSPDVPANKAMEDWSKEQQNILESWNQAQGKGSAKLGLTPLSAAERSSALKNLPGAAFGIEQEYDEHGRVKGYRYNVGKGLIGVAGAGAIRAGGGKFLGAISKDFNPQQYVLQNVAKQTAARATEKKGISFLADAKRKLVDFAAPIEDALGMAEAKYKFQVMPSKDVRLQIDRVLRSPTLAGQFAKDNGLEKVIKNVDNIDNLDQYLIAKHALKLSQKGIETGRNAAKDLALVEAFAPKYEPLAKEAKNYASKLLDYVTDSGLISKDLNKALKAEYPDYAPMNRIMTEIENVKNPGRSGIASVTSQSVVQKIKGSKLEVESPLASLLTKTDTAFNQAERNKAAQMITDYAKLPNNPFQLRRLAADEPIGNKATISVFKNGVKEVWETTPEIAEAAKNLNAQQMNIVLQTLALPTRIAKTGITGLYMPFTASNIIKDQGLTAVTSNRTLATSIANPVNFVKSLFSVLKHDELYDELVRAGAGGTSFDIARNQPHLTIDAIRANRNLPSKIKYVVRHPSELLRAVENIVGRSEELTRMTQFRGTRQALLKEGRTAQDATLLAAQAARENSANFARRGEWGQVLNATILYLNAGIQGSRSLVKALARDPKGTSTKIAATVFAPVAMTTLWNISDPKRLEAYKDIPEYEKNMNLIYIPSNPTKDEKGRWNVIKFPLPFGVGGLGYAIRKPIEQAYNIDKFKVLDMANQIISAVTPVNPEPGSMISTVLPQAIKGEVEWAANKDLFTGLPIVPEKMKNIPPVEQVRPGTSGTARAIGRVTNASPIQIEHYVRSKFGGLGSQALHASDVVANKLGLLPKEQIGGEAMGEGFARRFIKARGGEAERKVVEGIMPALGKQATAQLQAKQQAELMWQKLSDKTVPLVERNKLLATIPPESDLYKKISQIAQDESKGITYSDRLIKQLQVRNGARANYIINQAATMPRQEAENYLNELIKKGLINGAASNQINQLIPQLKEREKKAGRELWAK
jgi:hypothetical protein